MSAINFASFLQILGEFSLGKSDKKENLPISFMQIWLHLKS